MQTKLTDYYNNLDCNSSYYKKLINYFFNRPTAVKHTAKSQKHMTDYYAVINKV